jgi:DNA-binding transcriptional LysR family regulator
VAATDGAICGPLARAIAGFTPRYPGVQIELFLASSEQVVPALHRGDAELGAGLDIKPEPGIEIVARLPDILAAVVAPDHKLARRTKVAFAELQGQPIGTFERNSGIGRALQKLAARGAAPIRPTLITNSLEALKQMAATGTGIALLCRHSIQREIEQGQLVMVPLDADGPVTISLEIGTLRGERRSAALDAFIAELIGLGDVVPPT